MKTRHDHTKSLTLSDKTRISKYIKERDGKWALGHGIQKVTSSTLVSSTTKNTVQDGKTNSQFSAGSFSLPAFTAYSLTYLRKNPLVSVRVWWC
jgi:hypothetical protein